MRVVWPSARPESYLISNDRGGYAREPLPFTTDAVYEKNGKSLNGDRVVVENDANVLVSIVGVVVLSKLPELARFIRFEPYCLTLGAS